MRGLTSRTAETSICGRFRIEGAMRFAAAAIRLPLTTLGFVQYLSPSCALMLAIFVYGEVVPAERWFTFAFIWGALIIFSFEGLYRYRKQRRQTDG